MSLVLNHKWRIIEKSSGKTICILKAIDIADMFWFDGQVIPDKLFDKYVSEFVEVSNLHPDNNTDMDKLDEAMNALADKLRYEAIDHEHEIEEAILYIFEDLTAHFRPIWKE